MRKLLWIIGILLLIGGSYVVASKLNPNVDPMIAQTVGPPVVGAYNAIITSPFFMTWIAPPLNAFLIGCGLMFILSLVIWKKGSDIKGVLGFKKKTTQTGQYQDRMASEPVRIQVETVPPKPLEPEKKVEEKVPA